MKTIQTAMVEPQSISHIFDKCSSYCWLIMTAFLVFSFQIIHLNYIEVSFWCGQRLSVMLSLVLHHEPVWLDPWPSKSFWSWIWKMGIDLECRYRVSTGETVLGSCINFYRKIGKSIAILFYSLYYL